MLPNTLQTWEKSTRKNNIDVQIVPKWKSGKLLACIHAVSFSFQVLDRRPYFTWNSFTPFILELLRERKSFGVVSSHSRSGFALWKEQWLLLSIANGNVWKSGLLEYYYCCASHSFWRKFWSVALQRTAHISSAPFHHHVCLSCKAAKMSFLHLLMVK